MISDVIALRCHNVIALFEKLAIHSLAIKMHKMVVYDLNIYP